MADDIQEEGGTENDRFSSLAQRDEEKRATLDDADVDELSRAAAIEVIGVDRWPVDRRPDVLDEIGVPNHEVHLVRVELFMGLDALIKAGRVARADAARAFGVDETLLEGMLRGDHLRVTLDQAIRALADLGYRVMPRFFTMPKRQEKTV